MGGFVGAELAIAFPTRVSKLVLISAAGISGREPVREPLRGLGRLMAVGAARARSSGCRSSTRRGCGAPRCSSVIRYPEKLSVPLASELVVGAGTPGFVGGLDARPGLLVPRPAAGDRGPTLIVWGRNDILIPVEDAYEFERLIGANARLEIFEDTGHLAMLERPSRFNALLSIEFIAWTPSRRREPRRPWGDRALGGARHLRRVLGQHAARDRRRRRLVVARGARPAPRR